MVCVVLPIKLPKKNTQKGQHSASADPLPRQGESVPDPDPYG